MIIKIYRPDGSPDLTRWLVRCDLPGCGRTRPVMGSQNWLIPNWPAMPCYCPDCVSGLALILISSALACPGCHSPDVRIYLNDQPDPDPGNRWPHYAGCADCGHILMINDRHGGA
jgi:hypothetical protein